jgi:DNA-binding response OmpR family regulator
MGVPAWGLMLLSAAVGVGAMGLWHWLRLRRLRRKTDAQIETLETEKDRVEEARDVAADRVEKLEAMSTAKSQFLEEVSHAFRRPLTLTLGPIDTVLDGHHGPLDDEVRTQLRLARRNGTRVLWLVNQLMDLAELETGNMALTPTEGNLPAFVARCLRGFEDLAERREVTLGFESTLDDPTVAFDASKMEAMLANLLSSAFRAADEGGSIRMTVRSAPVAEETDADAEGDVELLVEHTGTDLSAWLDGDAFEWGREEPLLEAGHVSASVGFCLVDEFADLHGGRLQAGQGSGDTVQLTVRLPRHSDEGDPSGTGNHGGGPPTSEGPGGDGDRSVLEFSRRALSSTPSAESGQNSSGPTLSLNGEHQGALPGADLLPGRGDGTATDADANGIQPSDADDRPTILVIDDNLVICTLLRSHLEPEYRVVEAHDGAEGYTLARSVLPDLVLTDVMMPEVDGFELCRKIKKDPEVDHVPVVFLTARADLEDKVEGYDEGADAYITKPFEPEALIARVENLIEMRQTLRESFQDGRGIAAAGNAGVSTDGVENAEAALPPTAEANSLKKRIEAVIAEHLTDPEFGVSDLATEMALSASQLRRRMKGIYERTPVQLIRRRRLEAGARLLRAREDATIGEVAYAVGFNSQSYFSRSFRDEFGTSPSRYRADGVMM